MPQIPNYAPEFKPAEALWPYLKRVTLGNLECEDATLLALGIRQAKGRLRHKRYPLQVRSARYDYHV